MPKLTGAKPVPGEKSSRINVPAIVRNIEQSAEDLGLGTSAHERAFAEGAQRLADIANGKMPGTISEK